MSPYKLSEKLLRGPAAAMVDHIGSLLADNAPDTDETADLGIAAAFFLLPPEMNPDVCIADDDYGLRVISLTEFLGESTFDVFREDEIVVPGDSREAFDRRIETVAFGLAMGLAHLNALVRDRGAE